MVCMLRLQYRTSITCHWSRNVRKSTFDYTHHWPPLRPATLRQRWYRLIQGFLSRQSKGLGQFRYPMSSPLTRCKTEAESKCMEGAQQSDACATQVLTHLVPTLAPQAETGQASPRGAVVMGTTQYCTNSYAALYRATSFSTPSCPIWNNGGPSASI